MDENDLEDLWRDYWTRPKEVCQGLTRDMMIMMMMMMSSVPESQKAPQRFTMERFSSQVKNVGLVTDFLNSRSETSSFR